MYKQGLWFTDLRWCCGPGQTDICGCCIRWEVDAWNSGDKYGRVGETPALATVIKCTCKKRGVCALCI